MTDKELTTYRAESAEEFKAIRRILREGAEQLQAHQQQTAKEMKAHRAEYTEELKIHRAEYTKEIKAQQAKSDKEIAKIRKIQAESARKGIEIDKRIDRVGKQLGSIGITQGDFAEEFFYRSLEEKPQLGDIVFDDIRRQITMSGNKGEYDIILRNGDSIGIVEVKYKAHPDEMHSIIQNKVKTFRTYFREYKKHKLYFGIASMVTNPKVIENAKKEGIFLLTQQGKHLEIVAENIKAF